MDLAPANQGKHKGSKDEEAGELWVQGVSGGGSGTRLDSGAGQLRKHAGRDTPGVEMRFILGPNQKQGQAGLPGSLYK